MANDLAIVLTGTITPNAPFTVHAEPAVRRGEYLTALAFYRQFAPVVFLENSGYRLHDDSAFQTLANVELCEAPVSSSPERGKGYQEFEMLDVWVERIADLPPRFLKVTGRYIYRNVPALLDDCQTKRPAQMIVDLHPRSGRALSSLFCVNTQFYRAHLRGLYRECDDHVGDWIEKVLYRRLACCPANAVRLFGVEPDLQAICGSTGLTLTARRSRYVAKQFLRRLNCALDKQRLWYKR